MSTFRAVLSHWQFCCWYCGLGLFYPTYIYRPLPEYSGGVEYDAHRCVYRVLLLRWLLLLLLMCLLLLRADAVRHRISAIRGCSSYVQ